MIKWLLSALVLLGFGVMYFLQEASSEPPKVSYTPMQFSGAMAEFMSVPEDVRNVSLIGHYINQSKVFSVGETSEDKRLLPMLNVIASTTLGPEQSTLPHPQQRVFKDWLTPYWQSGVVMTKTYLTDVENQLLGYEIRTNDARIYVILNFSYDVHSLPFPLGFMSSTKVQLWRTDSQQIETFVTQWPLSVTGMSAVIVVV